MDRLQTVNENESFSALIRGRGMPHMVGACATKVPVSLLVESRRMNVSKRPTAATEQTRLITTLPLAVMKVGLLVKAIAEDAAVALP